MSVVAGVPYIYDSATLSFLAPGRTPLANTPPDQTFIPYVTVPDETNSGYQPALIDGTYSGPTTITTAGTIIRNKIINDRLIFQAANCGLDNCLVQSVGTASQQMQIDLRSTLVTGFTAYRTTFKPATLNYYTNSIAGHDWIAERCVVDGTVDGWSPQNTLGAGTVKNTNAQVRFCVLKQLAWFADDGGIHPAGSSVPGTHNDFMQLHNGAFVRVTGCAIHGYKLNALGTPALDGMAANLHPQISQIFLTQHTIGYIPGYLSGERTLTYDEDWFPDLGSWGGAPIVDHNWIWGGDNGIKTLSAVSFGSQSGQYVDLAIWVLGNTWMDYPLLYGSNPYPLRSTTNCYWNGTKYPASTGQGWTGGTSPAFDFGNRYSNDPANPTLTTIPSARRGLAVGLRVDTEPASVARA